jgi:acyl-CoA synthetase (AMP-forming)/AMP-acid ligase II/aryl carrier-like protein
MLNADRMASMSQLLGEAARVAPEPTAIEGSVGPPLSYGALWRQLEQTKDALNAIHIGRHDRVAIVLPNGPEMAAAFSAVAACATSAPLNPSYRASELEFYFSDLGVAALVVSSGVGPAAAEVAAARGIPIIHLTPTPDRGAGSFTLEGSPLADRAFTPGFAEPEDLALILHTSGTTSRPKMVPLTQRNLLRSARNIADTLHLTGMDACLNVMPLFHIHGLIAAVLASLTAHGRVNCRPGFVGADFFHALADRRATWYTAVPTIHQAALDYATMHPSEVDARSLRFIRSSSASLPPTVMAALEALFAVPVIEAYGMTEASHQMTSNALPPGVRKSSSVGVAAGPEVAIMDNAGALLPVGATGEVVIRGETVTREYLGNPDANAAAFTSGWFRTGDQGHFDGDGYLFLTGRLKELINRAGEKISPLEVDDALLQHQAVAQAVTFAFPHETLGEAVGAAVVVRMPTTEAELRAFVGARLAEHKVPQRIVFLDEIPKGPTGKIQRVGLAQKLGARLRPDFSAPSTERERALAAIWASVLKVSDVSTRDNFFLVGGDSLRMQEIIDQARRQGLEIDVELFLESATIFDVGRALDERAAGG